MRVIWSALSLALAAAAISSPARAEDVQLRASKPGTIYFSGPAGAEHPSQFTRLCVAPCTASFSRGSYKLAMIHDGTLWIPAENVHIAGPTTVDGELSGWAIAPVLYWGGLGLAAIGVAVMAIGGIAQDCRSETDPDNLDAPDPCRSTQDTAEVLLATGFSTIVVGGVAFGFGVGKMPDAKVATGAGGRSVSGVKFGVPSQWASTAFKTGLHLELHW